MNRSRFLLPYNIWIVCDRSQRERNVTWFRSSHVKGVDGLLGESRYYRLVSSNVSSGSVVLAGTSKREERKQGEARELAKIIRRREEKSRRKGGTLKYFKAKRRAEKSRRTWMKKRGSARKVQHFPRPPFFASFKNDELSRVMQWNAISSLQSSLDSNPIFRDPIVQFVQSSSRVIYEIGETSYFASNLFVTVIEVKYTSDPRPNTNEGFLRSIISRSSVSQDAISRFRCLFPLLAIDPARERKRVQVNRGATCLEIPALDYIKVI